MASGTCRRRGEEWVERSDYFTDEVYGRQANLCAERLGKGSRGVVDGEPDWRDWSDERIVRASVKRRRWFGTGFIFG